MNYRSVVIVKNGSDALFESLSPEKAGMRGDRSSMELVKKGSELRIEVTAKDATALRAILNSVARAFIIHEKMIGLKNGR